MLNFHFYSRTDRTHYEPPFMMRHARYGPQSPFPCALAPGQRLSCSFDKAPPAGGWKREGRLRIQGSESLAGREYSAVLNGTVALKSTTDVSEPSRRWRPEPAASAVPLTIRIFRL